ncbi:hypothetical protein PR202_gb00029 [Eleusine coracana subsp. coracana]|uniref:CR-type domain-containing protein n=1 Tax=Eleusine coracana subsp. coracana TaxID=191504 RepID=A0AAV5DSK5_ELECO|nr:hypothetical protein PR202_gb00029 [Eleusine coracana subsp. coracana]
MKMMDLSVTEYFDCVKGFTDNSGGRQGRRGCTGGRDYSGGHQEIVSLQLDAVPDQLQEPADTTVVSDQLQVARRGLGLSASGCILKIEAVYPANTTPMTLVQFSGALVPKLGEKPRLLPTSPAVARTTYADLRIPALQNGYMCLHRRGRCKYLAPSYSLHSQTSSEQLNHVPSSRFRHKRGSRFIVRAEAVSYSYFSSLCVLSLKTFSSNMIRNSNDRIFILYLVSQGMLANLKSKAVLSDDEKRSIYDKYGEAGLKGAGMGAGDYSNPFDLFESLFEGFGGMGGMGGMGGRAARNRPMQGDDEAYNLVLNFKEAVFGVEKEIEITRLESCTTCDGTGAKPGTKPTTCKTCGGQGQVVSSTRTPLGIFQQVSTCNTCGGTGEFSTPCNTCGGDSRVRKTKRISLKVPAGVDSGSRLRVRSEGNAGRRGGPPGDLYVFIDVLSDPVLKRDGTNILYTCKVSYIDAILGTTVKVPTVDGQVDLKIPSGTQPSTTLVMSKKGVPLLGKTNARGDQLVRVQVEIPKRLSSDERKLIEELADLNKAETANSRR